MSNFCTPNIYAIHTATSHLQPLQPALGCMDEQMGVLH